MRETDAMGERAIRAAFEGGPALVPYVVAGDPDPEATEAYVEALVRGGADVVELGLPFSEPIADGPTIESGIRRALDAGMTPSRYLDLVADLDVDVPIVTMTYYNLLFRYGDGDVEPFVADAAAAGVDGLIVPDLPVEESGPLREACEQHDLALVFIVAPTTTEDRIERIVEQASGFVYVQARLGTTGARADVSEQTYESLDRLPDADVPTAVGFGVSSGEQARAIVAGGADGVVAGSVFVDIVASGENVADRLERTAAEIKAGATEASSASSVSEPERT
ncbi:tryptophan synthase subunit alpha [Halanaeroarchaeum sulfurireducens]|uniref:Tryptophan synthase alpha chain n=2 Tax=Halanaeroarchaeum sulfurireducens TaxID=1604004 RepID=A0A0N7FTG8_9EURY|nr:tryptophan synthase subunit alpha [Halanaeroarchaeum sulfurireducens]